MKTTKRIKVTKEHRLAAAALAILNEEGPKLLMSAFATSEDHPCGTTCCIAGHAVLLDPKGAKPTATVLRECTADRIGEKAVDFFDKFGSADKYIFGGRWPSNRRQAAARSLYVLEKGKADPAALDSWGNPKYHYYKAPVPRNIHQRLRRFLHPEHPLYLPPKRSKPAKT